MSVIEDPHLSGYLSYCHLVNMSRALQKYGHPYTVCSSFSVNSDNLA